MKISFLLFSLFIVSYCNSQNYDGFVVTQNDSLFKGYMQISLSPQGRKVLITNDKKKKPRMYYFTDLKYYAYKKDTFALLQTFSPFAGENFVAYNIEGKIVINKGRLKLYYAEFPTYRGAGSGGVGTVIPGSYSTGPSYSGGKSYSTYVIKDPEGNLYGIKGRKKEFYKSMEIVIGDDIELVKRIENKELGYKDIIEIVKIYNANTLLRK